MKSFQNFRTKQCKFILILTITIQLDNFKRMMSQLEHPNIVKLFGITTFPRLRMVLEFCPLPDLRAHLGSKELLPDSLCIYKKKKFNSNLIQIYF